MTMQWVAAAARRPAIAWCMSWPGLWLLAVGFEVVAGGAAAWFAGRHGPAVIAVLVNVLIASRFASTLFPGREPLISRYARLDSGPPLSATAKRYTKALTAAWAGLLAGFAVVHGMAAWDWWTTETIAWIQGATCVAIFLGEHVTRSRYLPERRPCTPLRTLRAIWRDGVRGGAGTDVSPETEPSPASGPRSASIITTTVGTGHAGECRTTPAGVGPGRAMATNGCGRPGTDESTGEQSPAVPPRSRVRHAV